VLRSLKQRVGEELSPALFATFCYEVADKVLHWDDFEDEARQLFDGVYDPRPHPVGDLQTFAKDIILEFLPTQPKTVSKHTLADKVMHRYAEKYGWGSRARDAQRATYDALRELESVGQVQRTKWGTFVVGFADSDVSAIPVAEPVVDPVVSKEAAFTAEETIGEGNECVYVYFNEAERKLAAHEGRDWWPCKVGCTSQALSHRLSQQYPGTSIGRPPVVGLVIKTSDARALERALHVALDRVKTRIDDAVGTEWFDTSPRKITEWYLAQQQALGALQRK
jgi:hypothetical protein